MTEAQETVLDLMTTEAGRAAAVLTAALGCGLLTGIERERRKGNGPGRAFAGVRTFSLTSVLGAAAALSGQVALLAIGAAFVAGLGLMAYWRDRSDDPGVTTEIALLLTYVIGALTAWHMPVAAGLAVGMTGMLAARSRLHQLARQWLSPGELRDGIVLAAPVLMALPLVPDRPLWGDVLKPHVILQLLALLLALLVHAGSKSLTAGLVGGWRYLAWLAPGLWVHSLLAAGGIWWLAGR